MKQCLPIKKFVYRSLQRSICIILCAYSLHTTTHIPSLNGICVMCIPHHLTLILLIWNFVKSETVGSKYTYVIHWPSWTKNPNSKDVFLMNWCRVDLTGEILFSFRYFAKNIFHFWIKFINSSRLWSISCTMSHVFADISNYQIRNFELKLTN